MKITESVTKSSHQHRGPCYSSVGIGFNMTDKRHILPIVYTRLVSIRSISIIIVLVDLNEVNGSFV